VKVVFLAWRDLANPLAGGSEVLIDRLAGGLTDRGHDVTLVAGGPVGSRRYPVIDAGGPFAQYGRAPALVLRQYGDADLVVDVANGMSYLTPAWRRKPSVVLVNHVHTDQWRLWFGPALATVGHTMEKRVTPWLYRHRLFVAVSESTSEALQGLGVDPEHIRIVPNGVDMPLSVAAESDEPLFLAIGRLVPHKRYDALLAAWDEVRTRVGGRLVIIGEGPERSRLESLAGPGVELRGWVSEEEKQRLLGEAWLLLHPSMLEGWGLVVTEAAAAGTPALGFDAPGVRDSIVDGETGALARDTAAFVEEWADLGTNVARRQRLGRAAQRRAALFSWDRTVDRFLEVADEATASRRIAHAPRRSEAPPSRVLVPLRPSLQRSAQVTPEITIVVPAFNEADRLPAALPPLLDALADFDSEVIVVDDGSSDGTATVAARLLAGTTRPTVIRHDRNRGKGAAVRSGVAHARGRHIAFLDADGATAPDQLVGLIRALGDAHIAVGSRAAPGSETAGASRSRAYMGRAFNRWARAVTGLQISDFQCGFKAFRGPVAKLLFDLSDVDGFAFDVDVLALADRIGYHTTEVPVRWQAIAGGRVRPMWDAPEMALSVVQSQWRWTNHRKLAAVRARLAGSSAPDAAVSALTDRVGRLGTVVPWRGGALALLPFVDARSAARVAVQVQDELPAFRVRSAAVDARRLLGPDAGELRSAIATA
jgi:glycosyltransferase involved in cell wall biosynthesis